MKSSTRDELAYICARHFFFRYPALFENYGADLALKKEMIRETHRFLDDNFPNWRENHYLKIFLFSRNQEKRKALLQRKKDAGCGDAVSVSAAKGLVVAGKGPGQDTQVCQSHPAAQKKRPS